MIYVCKVCGTRREGEGPADFVNAENTCADCLKPGGEPTQCPKAREGSKGAHAFLSPHIDGSRYCCDCGYRWQPFSKAFAASMVNMHFSPPKPFGW